MKWFIYLMGVTCMLMGCEHPGVSVTINPEMRKYPVAHVAIVPFEPYQSEGTHEDHTMWWKDFTPNNGDVVSDIFANEFIRIKDYQFLERTQIRKVLQEQDMSLAGLIEQKTASEIGKLLGADAIIIGKVGQYYDWYNFMGVGGGVMSFSARMVHTQSGIVLWSASAHIDSHKGWAADFAREGSKQIAAELEKVLEIGSK